MSDNILSWKKFGGINNMEKTNNISTNSLSANYFTLKNSYVGYFSICGELSVSEDTYLGSNVIIGGNVQIGDDVNVEGNVFLERNQIVYGNVDIGGNVDICGNTLIRGNLHVLQNYEIEKNLKINGNLIQMGLLTRSPNLYGTNTYNINITAVDQKIGINNSNPVYSLDVCCNQVQGFSIASNLSSNENVVAQNNAGQGIIVSGNTTASGLNFFNESSMLSNTGADGSIIYNSGGNFIIKSSNNTFLNTTVSVSNRNLGLHTPKNETLVIYDISSGTYLYENYEDSSYNTGCALSLISDNNFSTTGLNIITADGLGLGIIAGSDSLNERSIGTFGVYDASDNIITTQIIIAGNNTITNRSTVGINTFKPITEQYVLDINGPTKINHNEIVLVSNCNFEIRNMSFSETNPFNGFVFGSPVYDSITNTYKQIIRYTNDGGVTWDDSFFVGTDPGVSIVLESSCIYDVEGTIRCIGFIGGGNGLLLFSTNNFQSWTQIDGTSLNVTITAIEVLKEPISDNLILFTTYVLNSQISIGYLIVSGEDVFTNNSDANFVVSTTTSFTDRSIFYSNTIPIYSSFIPITKINAMSGVDASYVLFAGTGGIGKVLINTIVDIDNVSTPLFSPDRTIINSNNFYTYNSGETYNAITTYNYSTGNYLSIAVGIGIISYTFDGGLSWNDITTRFSDVIFNSIQIHNLYCSIAVGNNGQVYASLDKCLSWNTINNLMINSGVENLISNSSYNLASVSIVNSDRLLIAKVLTPYVVSNNTTNYEYTDSKIYSCYFPDLFNHSNNNVLDVCGNMVISGDITVHDNVYISKNIVVGDDAIINGNTYILIDEHVYGNIYGYSGIFSSNINGIDNGNIDIGTLGAGNKTITISGATNALPNQIIIGNTTNNDNININGNSFIVNTIASNFINDVSMNSTLTSFGGIFSSNINGIDNGNIDIGTLGAGNKTITISGATNALPNQIIIGNTTNNDNVNINGNSFIVNTTGSNFMNDVSMNNSFTCFGNIDCLSNITSFASINTDYYNDVTGNLFLGSIGGNKTIQISGGSSATARNNVFIGGVNDNVTINGNNVQIIGSIATVESTLQLLSGYSGLYGSAGAGINIRDNSNNVSGFIQVNNELSGYVLKSSDFFPNILNIDVNSLSIKNTTDTFSKANIVNGLVILNTAPTTLGPNTTTMTTAWFDVSNILLGNYLVNYPGQQVMSTDFGIQGNVYLHNTTSANGLQTGTLQVNGGTSIIGNVYIGGNIVAFQNLSLSGNAIITEQSDYALQVLGGVQLYGNSFVKGNLFVNNSNTDFNGDVIFYGNTLLNSFKEAHNTTTGALQIKGGLSTTGNSIVGGNLVTIGNSFINGNIVFNSLATSNANFLFNGNTFVQGNLYANNARSDFSGDVIFYGNTTINSNKEAHNISTGALQIKGGLSTTGNIIVGGNILTIGNSFFTGNSFFYNTLDAVDCSSGSIQISGGVSIKKNVFINANINVYKTIYAIQQTDSTTVGTGSLILSGGASVAKNIFVGGNSFIGMNNTTTIIPLSIDFQLSSLVSQTITNALSYQNGIYIISSSNNSGAYYNVFNSDSKSNYWPFYYPSSSLIPTSIDGQSYYYDFLQIKLPFMCVLTSYTLLTFSGGIPTSWIVCGSIDGSTFDSLDYIVANTDLSMNTATTFYINSNNIVRSYNFFRIVILEGTNGFIEQFYLNGFPTSLSSNVSLVVSGASSSLGNIYCEGSINISNTTQSTTVTTGALVVSGGVGITGNTNMGNSTVNFMTIKSNLGIGTSLPGYTLDVSGNMNVSGQFLLGNLILTNSIETSNIGLGALIVKSGGASIAGNTYIGGNVVLSSQNSTIFVSGNANIAGTLHSNIVIGSQKTLIVDTSGSFICNGTFYVNTFALDQTNDSYSTTTGSFIVSGGCGIAGNLNVGGNLYISGNATFNKNLVFAGNTIFTSDTDISSNNTYIRGNLLLKNTTDTDAFNTGCLQVSGGSSVIGNVFIGGNVLLSNQMIITANISSNSVGSGTLLVLGGSSISQDCYIGGNTVLYGKIGNTTSSGIIFPATISPSYTSFANIATTTTTIYGVSVPNLTYATITGQDSILSYQNGDYFISSGTVPYSSIYGASNALILNSSIYPWISSYTYDNTTGIPTTIQTQLITNTFNGDWLQYGLPYQLILHSYNIIFSSSTGKVLECFPNSWYVLGSNNISDWSVIDSRTNIFSSVPSSITYTYTISNNNTSYLFYRFIVSGVIFNSNGTGIINTGSSNPGIYSIQFSGVPRVSPVSNQITSSTTTTDVNINTTGELTLPLSGSISSLVGENTFAGNSTLVTFGNQTTYGNVNIFENLNIFGNIYQVNSKYLTTFNSDLYVNGNTTFSSNTIFTGTTNLKNDFTVGVEGSVDNVNANIYVYGTTTILASVSSSSAVNGNAFKCFGGIGVTKASYFNSTLNTAGILTVSNSTSSSNSVSGNALQCLGGIGITNPSYFNSTLNTAGILTVSNSTSSSNSVSGNALQCLGGIGITNPSYFNSTINTAGILTVSNTSSSASSVLGNAFQCLGGIGVTNSSYFNSTLNTNGVMTVSNTSSSATLVSGNAFQCLGGIGISNPSFFNSTLNTAGILTVSNTSSSATLVSGNALQCLGGIGITNPSYFNSTLNTAGILTVSNSTSSSNSVSGNAFQCLGGIGITNPSYFNSTLNTAGILTVSNATFSAGSVTGNAFQCLGGIGITNPSYFNSTLNTAGILTVSNSTSSSSSVSGNAFQCLGGIGITNPSFFNSTLAVNGIMTTLNSSSSSSSVAGNSLQCTGGIGVTNASYFNSTLTTNGVLNAINTTSSSTTVSGNAFQCLGGIGVTKASYFALSVTANSFNAGSDYRIKENVQELDQSFTIDNLRPVHYINKKSNKQDIGLIAHELQQEFPYLVSGIKDGDELQTINYLSIIGLLIYEIQNLKKIVKDLQNK